MSEAAGRPTRWHPALVTLHWLTLLLVVTQFVVASPMRDEARNLVERFEYYQLHKSVGLTVASLIVLRLVLRLTVAAPPPANPGLWLRVASDTVHAGLYLCLIVLPVTGFLMVSSAPLQIPTLYFGWFAVPHPIGPDKATYELMRGLHYWLGNLLLTLAAIHVAAALVHVLLWRDGLLRRMSFGRRWVELRGDQP